MKKIIYILMFILMFSIASALTVTRTISGSDITYTVSNAPSKWGVLIEETVTGDCTFSDATKTYKNLLLSDDGSSLTETVLGTSSCTVSGKYSYSDGSSEVQNLVLTQATVTGTTPIGTGTTDWTLYAMIAAVIIIVIFLIKK